MIRRQQNKLRWLLAGAGVAGTATILALRYYDRTLDEEAARLSDILNLAPGKTVAEIGAGRGSMSVRIAELVAPGGKVLSTDIEPKKLVRIHHAAHQARLTNVVVIGGTQTGAEFRDNSCDAAFMRVSYHHLTSPAEFDRSLFRAIKPGGILAVIDFPPKLFLSLFPVKGVPSDRGGHGIRKELLVEELTRAGFERVGEYAWPFWLYCIVFRKPAT